MEVQKNQQSESETVRNLMLLVKKGKISPNNRIYFFGANKSSLEMNAFLQKCDFIPQGFIDNSSKKQDTFLEGLPVLSPAKALYPYDENVKILIASEYFAQMSHQLENMNYKKNKHFFVVLAMNDSCDTSTKGFEEQRKMAEKGLMVYKNVMEGRNGEFLFICPYAGTGDIFLIGGYLGKYMKKHTINTAIATIVNRSCEKILKLYGIDGLKTSVISQNESDALVVFFRVMKDTVPGIILNDNYKRIMHRRLRGYKGINFQTMFKYAVFNMEKEDIFSRPLSPVGITPDNTYISNFFENNGLIFGRTAILSPYANTISNLPMEAWEEISEILNDKGYVVCTNSASEKEPPIRMTKPLFIPFSMVSPVLEAAGLFIAMRSGLCDIVASTACKKIIFYPKGCIFGSCSTYEYFSLNSMGFSSNAEELEFDSGHYKDLLDYIKRNVKECKK